MELSVTKKGHFDILIPPYRDRSNGESDKAKALFRAFLAGNFSYDALSNHPGYMGYASAETLIVIIPLIIDELLRRKDILNYLVYPLISAIDPEREISGSVEVYKERAARFVTLADGAVVDKICQLLNALKAEPPLPEDQFDNLVAFWQDRQRSVRAN